MAKSRKLSSRKSNKSNKSVKTFLHSKLVLYLSLILFIFNILAFLFFKDMQSLFLLLIVLCITYMFDQNMILVLMVPMLFVGTLIILRKTFMDRDLVEGMEDGKGSGGQQQATGQQATGQQATGQQATGQQATGQQSGSVDCSDPANAKHTDCLPQQQATGQQATGQQATGQQATGQQGTGQQGTGQQGSQSGTPPDSEPYSNINSTTTANLKNELNKLVNKYEEVQKEFNDSVENSSLDPQSLEAQKAVAKQMNALTPLIKDSVGILNKVDLNGLNKFIGSFGNLIGSVSTPQPVSSSTKV